jgi:hypothetical protein
MSQNLMMDESLPKHPRGGHYQILIEAVRESHVSLSLVLTKLTRPCFAVRSKTKYSPGLAEASWPKRAVSRSATASKPHGIPTKVSGKKIESR